MREMAVLIFDAALLDADAVSARVAVSEDQELTALHDAVQQAFDWDDGHLYSFWLDGEFWGDEDTEYTRPDSDAEPGQCTADVAIETLDLTDGAKIAYLFDFGDSWHVSLVLRERADPDGGTYPRVLERTGTAPPQYPDYDDDGGA
jgi:Plasmid pRiA4b ORF-3-like protein